MSIRGENVKMVGKLAVVAGGMFAFGYALIPIYKHICEMTGINILSLSERQVPGNGVAGKDVKLPANTQQALPSLEERLTSSCCFSFGMKETSMSGPWPSSIMPRRASPSLRSGMRAASPSENLQRPTCVPSWRPTARCRRGSSSRPRR